MGYAVDVELLFAAILLTAAVLSSYFISRTHFQYIQSSGAAMILGMVFGGLYKLIGAAKGFSFGSDLFYYVLLPPIVYAAGLQVGSFTFRPALPLLATIDLRRYFMAGGPAGLLGDMALDRKSFYTNFWTISIFAVVGTIVACFVFGLGNYAAFRLGWIAPNALGDNPLLASLLYGALISATDPVGTLAVFSDLNAQPLLYAVAFGESVLNDAIAVVLFDSFRAFEGAPFTLAAIPLAMGYFCIVSVGSIVIGIGTGLATAVTIKQMGLRPAKTAPGAKPDAFETSVYAVALLTLSAYVAYLLSIALGLSGIMALFFAGIANAQYSYYNISAKARTTVTDFYKALSFLSETFVFSYIGLQVATLHHAPDVGLDLLGLPLCLLSRAVGTFPLAWLCNLWRDDPLTWQMQVMLFACGLRGAIAYSLAITIPVAFGGPALSTATLIIVLTSSLGFGSITGPLLRRLDLVVLPDDDGGGDDGEGGHARPSTATARKRAAGREYAALGDGPDGEASGNGRMHHVSSAGSVGEAGASRHPAGWLWAVTRYFSREGGHPGDDDDRPGGSDHRPGSPAGHVSFHGAVAATVASAPVAAAGGQGGHSLPRAPSPASPHHHQLSSVADLVGRFDEAILPFVGGRLERKASIMRRELTQTDREFHRARLHGRARGAAMEMDVMRTTWAGERRASF